MYGQYVVGGIIGLQVNTDSEKTYISNVISLTNWNVSDDNISIRDEITKKLYNNYKFMYTNSDNEYFNYYIKMEGIDYE